MTATAAGGTAATRGTAGTAATRATRCPIVLKRRYPLRGLFIVADGKNPIFGESLISAGLACRGRVAVPLPSLLLFTFVDEVAHVDHIVVAHHDILATRTERVPGSDRHLTCTRTTDDL